MLTPAETIALALTIAASYGLAMVAITHRCTAPTPPPPPAPEPEALQPAHLTLRLRRADRDAVLRGW